VNIKNKLLKIKKYYQTITTTILLPRIRDEQKNKKTEKTGEKNN
jgi:hypothetical protein